MRAAGWLMVIGAIIAAVAFTPLPTSGMVFFVHEGEPGVFAPGPLFVMGLETADGYFLYDITEREYRAAKAGERFTLWRRWW